MIKKTISMLILMTVVLILADFTPEAKAGSHTSSVSGWKEECKQTTIGKQCKKYKDHTIVAKWTKTDVINTAKAMDKAGSYNAAVVNTLVGYVNFPLGAIMAINSLGWQYNEDKFYYARSKGYGLQLKYTYRLYMNQNTGKVLNPTWYNWVYY